MDNPESNMRVLAQVLLGSSETRGELQSHHADRIFEALRISITSFAGAEGFLALMRRSLSKASAKLPSLNEVTLKPDGALQGLNRVDVEAATELLTQLFNLLVVFIGEPLTVTLVTEALPELLRNLGSKERGT